MLKALLSRYIKTNSPVLFNPLICTWSVPHLYIIFPFCSLQVITSDHFSLLRRRRKKKSKNRKPVCSKLTFRPVFEQVCKNVCIYVHLYIFIIHLFSNGTTISEERICGFLISIQYLCWPGHTWAPHDLGGSLNNFSIVYTCWKVE